MKSYKFIIVRLKADQEPSKELCFISETLDGAGNEKLDSRHALSTAASSAENVLSNAGLI